MAEQNTRPQRVRLPDFAGRAVSLPDGPEAWSCRGEGDAVLARAAPLQSKRASPPAREAMLAALNGVLGDHLRATANPLLIGMELRQGGKALVLEPAALAQRLPNANASGKVLVLVHGLSMNDLQWRGRAAHATATHDHGAFLADALGYTPVYVRYNTGLSIAENGRLLNEQLAQLWQAWPVPITTLTLLTHSMGGLVSRSAWSIAVVDRSAVSPLAMGVRESAAPPW